MSPSQQGKKARKAPAPPPDRASARRRLGMLVFGVLFVVLFVGVALAQGLGSPSVPEGDIAVVEDAPDGTITQEEFDSALAQTAVQQGLPEVPPEDDPQFELLKQSATSDLILSRWVLGEAEERGIEVTDREIDQELETVKNDQFGSEKAFEKFLRQSSFCTEEELAAETLDCAAVNERIRLQLISDRIQQAVLPEEPEITQEEIQTFYDENASQFEQPELRDVRVVLTKTEEEANQALAELEQDSSPKGWEAVAKKYSVDEATKSSGGLREAVVEGQSEPTLDEQTFAATEGELVGPFEGDAGFYVIQVESISPAEKTPLADAEEQIRQTLVAARQQEVAQTFQEDFSGKWRARTFCAEDYAIDRCSNSPPPPDTCTEEAAEKTGCGAPVPSTKPIAPGTAGVFGAPAPTGKPQGPITPQAAAAEALPPGLVPGGAGGAVPPGAAPQGGAPPVPPGG